MKRAVVVAHPDDEILWGAGIVLRNPGDWTIICCSIPQADPVRAVKFLDAVREIGAVPHVHHVVEPSANESMKYLDDIDLSIFDHIVTHGAAGEYGHLQHKDVHRHITRKYGKKALTFFGYRPDGAGEHKIELTEFEAARKLKALKKYDHIHPFGGIKMPKWEALIDLYVKKAGMNFNVETYDGHFAGLSEV